ncbi:MAG: hypothetical protein ABSE70_10995 [Candidatus Limnocylindrales bacterium]
MFERDVIERLEAAGIEYFVTGSVALGAWATFRQTNDVDVVVHIPPGQYETRLRPAFEPDYIVNPLEPHGIKWLGAVISIAEAQKADMIVREPDAWGESAFARRVSIDDPALGQVWVSSPEDLIVAKLEFSDGGRSERQLDDCRVVVRTRSGLDWEYLDRYARELGLASLLDAVR